MKRIFVIDWMLLLVFILTACTGFGLHMVGYGGNHELWHNWAVFHIASSLLFLGHIIKTDTYPETKFAERPVRSFPINL